MSHQTDIEESYLYAKEPFEGIHQKVINKCEDVGLKHFVILKLLLNTRMTWIIFTKILKNTIQVRNIEYALYLSIPLLIYLAIKN